MQTKQPVVFEQCWSFWLTGLSCIALMIGTGLSLWLRSSQNATSQLHQAITTYFANSARDYNNTSHAIFIFILVFLAAVLLQAIARSPDRKNKTKNHRNWSFSLVSAVKRHPAVTIILTVYIVLMVQESSWFYKEILTWYDDIYTDHLLNNFRLRESFISETMRRNDFRFFPLSHQDLHVLSWLTPYTKIWSLVSGVELIATIVLGCKIVEASNKGKSSASLMIMGTLLFLFTSATAFNYFQFIYSERILTCLLALFTYQYCTYQREGSSKNGRAALLFALFIPFFKDTAIILVTIPAITTIALGSFGKLKNYPRWNSLSPSMWAKAYALEIAICSLIPFFLATFVILSALPSIAVGVQRYDSHLGFSSLALDTRLIIFIAFLATRLWLIQRNRVEVTALDGLNLAALIYGFALFGLVGLDGSNYMTLPIQFVAVLDILMIWESLAAPRLHKMVNSRQAQAIALGATMLILTFEDRQSETFRQSTEFITRKQRSWRKTFNKTEKLAIKARRRGESITLIYSKGWFQHSDQMKSLPYDRLVYYDIDTREYKVKEGAGKGMLYSPKKGDYLIDIDTGKKLTRYGIDLSQYELLYEERPNRQYGRIFRHL
ncbi:hypothetical protein MITS9509_00376 [Synechococcus sp. MIT S9509]|uniref:hypothetical protein n=1 Tax=Synechococcus sp. MIT S9509 TaxID=1801630 RepID=UPI0007BBF8F3|nr:hypothetical protein [Synechococcus sp. MIT S9509]KZR93781.1 hypothetical protein MITS9509_00376 [Synechococcus sp. MIT S9509]